ncbi:MAG TPA: hypothetical protein VLU99_03345, partial [Nitrososphaerales archaeon]|nr:hypothetical protein [Nitrososphaerales archaeon]
QLISSLNFPIMLFSQAFYPSGRLPAWMSGITAYNPVSFSAEISRTMLFGSDAAIAQPTVVVGFVALAAFVIAASALLVFLSKKWL